MPDPYQQIIDALSRCKRVLITTHVRPDGDALGTTAAMVLGLRKKNIDAEVILLSHLPHKYAFVYHDNAIVHHDVEKAWPGEEDKVTRGQGDKATEVAASSSPCRPLTLSP